MRSWFYTFFDPEEKKQTIGAISTPTIPGINFRIVKEQLIKPYLKSIGIIEPANLTYERKKNSSQDTIIIKASQIKKSIMIDGEEFDTNCDDMSIESSERSLSRRMLFCNIGWMANYIGSDVNKIKGGGSYNNSNIGMEIYNFKPYKGMVCGFVQPSGKNGSIHIEKLGAEKDDTTIKNVLVIWTAPHPDGGTFIVGWYKNATVFRDSQQMRNHNRKKGFDWYNIVTKDEDADLLPIDDRVFRIPRADGKNKGIGQSNVWYADSNLLADFRKEVIDYINDYGRESDLLTATKRIQTDPQKRQKVEKIAVEATWKYYVNKGFRLKSVEKDNVGWDLEAEQRGLQLRIEVKGLSGASTVFELTPNEYANMKKYKGNYRIAVVTNCLVEPILTIYYYISEEDCWGDNMGNKLNVKEIVSARLSL